MFFMEDSEFHMSVFRELSWKITPCAGIIYTEGLGHYVHSGTNSIINKVTLSNLFINLKHQSNPLAVASVVMPINPTLQA